MTDMQIVTDQTTAPDIARIKQAIYEEWQSPAIVAAYRKWDVQEIAWGSKVNG